MHTKLFFIIILVWAQIKWGVSQTPANQNTKSVLILGATLHVGNGEVIENSAIGFKKGKITLVGNATQRNIIKTEWDEIIEANGKHIYPGFISPNTVIGLTEIDAVRASLDFNEIGDYNPNARSLIAYNAESKITPTVRFNGVLIAQSVPRGGLIAGKSSVFNLDGWNWEDAVLKADDGVWINWPRVYSYNQTEEGKWEYGKNKNRDKQLNELNTFFDKAIAYHKTKDKPEIDVRLESLKEVLSGNQRLYLHANGAIEINEAVMFAKSKNIKQIVLAGGQDVLSCLSIIKENKIPVILERIHNLPPQPDDDINYFYQLPATLKKEGILFCLSYAGDMEAMGSRNLPFTAGTTVAYGLPYEEAISSITLNTAKILGIDNVVGSLEEGKNATLFISDGDALDMRTNKVIKAYINGNLIDMDNHQLQLYNKYKKKYGLN